MPIRLPGLEIHEPLRRRPIAGAIVGIVGGAILGLFAGEGHFPASVEQQRIGFLAGGMTGGIIIGSLAPLFRRRFTAGISVGLATMIGLWIANVFLREFTQLWGIVAMGSIAGFLYSIAFWDYRSDVSGGT